MSTTRAIAFLALGFVFSLGAACGSSSTAGGFGGATDAGPASTGSGTGPGHPGQLDSGITDAGGEAAAPVDVSKPSVDCTDTLDNVYITPTGLSAMTMADRGAIVRCSFDVTLQISDVTTELAGKNISGITIMSGTGIYRIAYRTYRDDGVAGVSTARVYLPDTPRSSPLPIIAIGHPTDGIADSCAPSEDPTSNQDLALPWAARGYAVIVSDYAGLGNEGIQGYVMNHDTAHSLLDSARALRALLPSAAFDNRVLLAGFSQGGGAVMAAQGLAGSYGAGGDVVAAIVFAPEWFSRINSFAYVTMLNDPTELTIETGVSKPVVAAFRAYAYAYNELGPSSVGMTFPAGSGIPGQVNTLCQTPFGGYVQGAAPHVSDLMDDTFRTTFLSCVNGTSGCSGAASDYHTYLMNDIVAPDPKGAPVLYVQGLADIIMPPNEEAACNLQILQSAGVSTQLCVDPTAQHTDVVARNVSFAEGWSEAALAGTTLPTCSGSGLPACTP